MPTTWDSLVNTVLAQLDVLRDSRLAKTISEDEYHAESDRLWAELRMLDSERKVAEKEKEERLEASAKRRDTDPDCPYKTLKEAYLDGWKDLEPEDYGYGAVMTLKGHKLIRDGQRAQSETHFKKAGFKVKAEERQQPHAWSSNGYHTFSVYREDQLEP
jgi:hypothetical protein